MKPSSASSCLGEAEGGGGGVTLKRKHDYSDARGLACREFRWEVGGVKAVGSGLKGLLCVETCKHSPFLFV